MLHIWCLFCCFHSFGRLAVSSFSHTGRSLPIYRLCHGFSFSLLHYGRISYPSLHLSLIRTNVFSFTLYLHLSFSRLLVVRGFLFAGMLIIIIIIIIIINNAARPLECKHSHTPPYIWPISKSTSMTLLWWLRLILTNIAVWNRLVYYQCY